MTDQVATAAPAAASGSDSGNVFSRLFGVLTSPRETFAGIVARPRWLAAMAIVALFIAFAQYAFLSTQVGQDAMVDQQMRQTERWTGNLADLYAAYRLDQTAITEAVAEVLLDFTP